MLARGELEFIKLSPSAFIEVKCSMISVTYSYVAITRGGGSGGRSYPDVGMVTQISAPHPYSKVLPTPLGGRMHIA